MTGTDAAVHALLDSGVKIVTGVPGYPVTGLMEALGKKIRHEWSVNEKVALELMLGSSVCGERSAVITKHVGMNILADPLVTSATHTIGAGVVIFAGDDPGVQKSQNEQDSRFYGLIAEVPVFDPSTPEALYLSIREAFGLSERVSTPVIIRLTDRLLKSEGNINRINEPDHKPPSFDKKIWHITMLGKHQRFHGASFPEMCRYAESCQLNVYKKRGTVGIISSGFPSSLVESVIPENVSHLSLGIVNPLPLDMVKRFLDEHEHVLVVEETEPVIEKQLPGKALGKLTGHMPYGLVEIRDIQKAIENIHKDKAAYNITPQTVEERGERPVCEDCPYIPLYNAVKELDVPVAGDLGCAILTSQPHFSLLDAAFSLGSAIGTACGFNRKGIAIIGDFGLAHSGMAGLINAVHNEHEVVVVVLQNEIAAMTGGQKVPDLTGLVESCVQDTEIIDPQADVDIKVLLEEKLKKKGISVILARARCPRY
ncbi:thiamine pyrophosphate-dependent enzyme [Candidatus Methanoperedens nitratireducens]|uniref:Indolepyruvate oxidoreductase subunit IorA n=1 Tax=Candidatus Methanoperedens nitratireducens TaxID=1392998 RepID=A0A284VIH9_9EURY|nr:thiamine pyrophosphate-dependent enzyme [Candidatus Methanoperedens nitroreducens]SNQ59083.1 Indolepyruvate ferredoxin oxidoreductase [Candidatus Methanoperedens nitroreducens]